MRLTRGRRALVLALCAGALAVAWVQLRPAQLGGDLTMAVVSGRSMSPGLRSGDLALVRSASEYRPGDVVGYRTKSGTVVLHRVVRTLDDSRLVLRGDNNGYDDPYLPTPEQVIGRMTTRVPWAGWVVDTLRQPRWAAPLVGAVAFVVCRRSMRRTMAAGAPA